MVLGDTFLAMSGPTNQLMYVLRALAASLRSISSSGLFGIIVTFYVPDPLNFVDPDASFTALLMISAPSLSSSTLLRACLCNASIIVDIYIVAIFLPCSGNGGFLADRLSIVFFIYFHIQQQIVHMHSLLLYGIMHYVNQDQMLEAQTSLGFHSQNRSFHLMAHHQALQLAIVLHHCRLMDQKSMLSLFCQHQTSKLLET